MLVVAGIPVSRVLVRLARWHVGGAAVVIAAAAPAWASPGQQAGAAPASRELFTQVWKGAAAAQTRHTTACGTLTETRRSPLLARPLVLHGTFCVGGPDQFRLEYAAPNPFLVIYNDGALNVSTDGGKQTDAFDVGDAVKRAQGYFSGPRALQNLEHDFAIDVTETADEYALELSPVAGRFARRLTRVVVGLGKADFLPRRIVIGGKSGVTSTFDVRIDTLDGRVDPSLFRAYRVRPPRDRAVSSPGHDEARH
jgi:outer membrane lipoprotein-sorting protein